MDWKGYACPEAVRWHPHHWTSFLLTSNQLKALTLLASLTKTIATLIILMITAWKKYNKPIFCSGVGWKETDGVGGMYRAAAEWSWELFSRPGLLKWMGFEDERREGKIQRAHRRGGLSEEASQLLWRSRTGSCCYQILPRCVPTLVKPQSLQFYPTEWYKVLQTLTT